MSYKRIKKCQCPTCRGPGYVTEGFMAKLTLWFFRRFG